MALFWCFTAIMFMLWDVWYYAQSCILLALSMIQRRIYSYDIMDESVYCGVCLTTDLDAYFHMNNARYLRECDFGRFLLWCQSGAWDQVRALNSSLTLGASTIRYRKSLNLMDRYNIVSRILCWDEKAFYVEQRFVRTEDKFIMAIVLIKQSVVNCRPADVVSALKGRQMASPPIPDDVKAWIQYNTLSSEKLKKEM